MKAYQQIVNGKHVILTKEWSFFSASNSHSLSNHGPSDIAVLFPNVWVKVTGLVKQAQQTTINLYSK